MAMAAHIDRRTIDEAGEICTVIQIETPHEILVRLARSGVLRRDHARDDFNEFTHSPDRSCRDVIIADDPFGRRLSQANLVHSLAPDVNNISRRCVLGSSGGGKGDEKAGGDKRSIHEML